MAGKNYPRKSTEKMGKNSADMPIEFRGYLLRGE